LVDKIQTMKMFQKKIENYIIYLWL